MNYCIMQTRGDKYEKCKAINAKLKRGKTKKKIRY